MKCPAPSSFRSAGEVVWAEPTDVIPGFAKVKRRRTGKRAEGMRYEARVHEHLQEMYREAYVPSQWVRFRNEFGKLRWCQPDGMLIDVRAGRCVVIEVKYNHTSDAWWQLRHLYMPVLEVMLPGFEMVACEVVKWFDPATKFPEPIHMTPEVGLSHPGKFNLHIWAPGR